jgi:hypothetical protein
LAQPGTLWEIRIRQHLPDTVLAWIGDVTQGVEQTKGLEHACVNTDTNRRIALLDALEGRSRRKGTLRHHGHRQAAPAACIANVRAQLAQHATHSGGGKVWRRHNAVFMHLYSLFV